MQRAAFILACFFICVTCFSQQYPFVHYTPRDGLISNQIKNIYQDSKGRLYFTSINGLSIYDGSRFINYTSKNGLGFDIVNCVMEMGDDSIWIFTNSPAINCFAKGKMINVNLNGKPIIVNQLIRDEQKNLYAASDEGLYKFFDNEFIKLPFIDINGKDRSRFISFIHSSGDYLLVEHDYSLLPGEEPVLYLYNKITQKIVAKAEDIITLDAAPDGRIWVTTDKNVMAMDTVALNRGKIILKDLPPAYDKIKNLGRHFIDFDRGNNCWLGDQSSVLLKIEPDGHITSFSGSSGLNMYFINAIFLDRENITWIATNNAGVNKLVQSNFSLTANPFGFSSLTYDISSFRDKGQLLLYSNNDSKLAIIKNDSNISYLNLDKANETKQIIETPYGFFGLSLNKISKLTLKDNTLYPGITLSDSIDNVYSGSLVDRNGNFIICGKKSITAIVNGATVCRKELNFFADQPAIDSKGNIWVATRAGELTMFTPNTNDPVNYLERKKVFPKDLQGLSPRSIIIDNNDNIWIGTRRDGIIVFSVIEGSPVKKFSITTASGLSDDFTTHLTCDANNNIWACSALGLDKISVGNGMPVVENITKQNNIYQSVFKVVIDKNNTAWGLISNGLIKIFPESEKAIDYTPSFMLSMVKTGKDTIVTMSPFSHKQNNLSFYFSATSFIDEKQVLYSYRLQGGSNTQWSEPSNNTTVSFIDLHPGDYVLDIKAVFPASRYPEQLINYKFSISPAWWQTWWFRTGIGILGIGFIVAAIRFYYRRTLEKEKAILEKQQAIEKERTRIATDMHDDLGAGLSRIKFLSETIGIKKQLQQPIEEDITKIREYSNEMIDKMGEIVWALNEKNDSLSDLLSYTRVYAMEYLSQNGIRCIVETPEQFPVTFVSGEFRRNIYLTLKEALHNVVKHAQASEVMLKININHDLNILIKDDGTGFDRNTIRSFSNGLVNMSSRIKESGGQFEIINNDGTEIRIRVPLPA